MIEALSDKERKALVFLRNYLVHSGRMPSIRELQRHLEYSSPRAAAYILERLVAKKAIHRPSRGKVTLRHDLPSEDHHARTILVPLVGSAPCGSPLLAEENREMMVPISTRFTKPGQRYFLLRAVGDSMTEVGIQDGNLVLVQQRPIAENGEVVVALIDGEATIKEFHRQRNAVVLKPRSKNSVHKPIILTEDFKIMGVVQKAIDNSTLKL